MKQTVLPGTDIQVSQLALGCWGLTSDFHWGDRDAASSMATINAAMDAGITLFDTAAMYADGENESLLGKVLATNRTDVQIATKTRPDQQSAETVKTGLNESLDRLQTDFVDLYQVHWAGSDAELAEVWGAMTELKSAGKARAIGVCNLGPSQLDIVTAIEPPATNQLAYNLLFRAIEFDILPRCKKEKIGVMAYSPLMHGMLRGDWRAADEVPETRARTRHFSSDRQHVRHGEGGHEGLTFDTIECLSQFAEVSHNTLVSLAIRWLAAQKPVTTILVGASSPEQIQANVEMVGSPLNKELQRHIDQVTDPLKQVMGSNADLWQGSSSRVR